MIDFIDPETGEERSCCASLVSRVISRAPHSTVPNRFRDNWLLFLDKNDPDREPREGTGALLFKRGILFGTLEGLVSYCLAKLPFALENPIHAKRTLELFNKQRPGLILLNFHCVYTVNEKVFMAWVRANATRLCATRQEANAQQREWDADREADYYADLDAEWEQEHPKHTPAVDPKDAPIDEGFWYSFDEDAAYKDEMDPLDQELSAAEASAQALEEESLAALCLAEMNDPNDDDPAGLDNYGPLDADDLQAIRLHESEKY